MPEQVKPDVFEPPHHKLRPSIEAKLEALLKEYASQSDETSISITPLTKMTIDTGTSEPVSQKPYLIAMKHKKWVKEEIEKLQPSDMWKLIQSVSTNHSCTERRWREMLTH